MADIDYARTTKWYHFVGDFLNTLKAFIGTNYQALPFAFANSGLGFGVVGVFIVATLTDHCCQLLVSNKDIVVSEICDEDVASGRITEEEIPHLRERLLRSIGYGDLGRRVLGRWTYQLIQALVWFTQFSTCVGYFIFIGNTIYQIFPLKLIWFPIHNSSVINETHYSDVDYTLGYSNGSYSTTTAPSNTTQRYLYKSMAPPLQYIILFPLPLFLCTSMIRRIRVIAPLSTVATGALFLGAAAVAGFLLVGFSVTEFCWYKFSTLPLFLSQLISAYEGIGCILPIQSSMVGHRHLFSSFLHANIYLIFFILCFFGIVGYLRYGDGVSQIIVTEITQHTVLSILVDITLIISVLFTYPLQCFPVIEIMEAYLLAPGKCCNRKKRRRLEFDEIDDDDDDVEESRGLIDSVDVSAAEVSAIIPPTVAAWKRNSLRVLLTLIIAGFAVLLRDNFAYLGSFTGAVGCTSLAYIIPCIIDIRLRRSQLSWFAVAKDICIILFGGIVSILALAAIIRKIVTGQKIKT